MITQLRIYTINRGQLEEFVELWRKAVAPLRKAQGFQILASWIVPETHQFVWILGYDGPSAWEAQARAWLPPWLAFDLRRMYEHFQRNGLRATPDGLAAMTALLGHPPRELDPFVRETAEGWKA